MAIRAALAARGEKRTQRVWCRNRRMAPIPRPPRSAASPSTRCRRDDGRPRRSRGAEGRARPGRRRDHADQSEHLRPVRARNHRDRRRGARGGRLFLLRRRQFQRHRRARCGRAISASTPCTSICTRRSPRRMAAAGRARGRWCCRQRSRRSRRCRCVVRRRDGSRLVEHATADAAASRSAACARSTARWACSCARSAYMLSHGARRLAPGLGGCGAQRQLHPRLPRRT